MWSFKWQGETPILVLTTVSKYYPRVDYYCEA